MKKNLLFLAALFFLGTTANAQLANWTPGGSSAFTNFPNQASGQINGLCRITQLKFHVSDPNKMYTVTSQGGLFTTVDQGFHWTVAPGTETLTSNCASVCVDYTNDQVIYLGTGDPNYYSNGIGVLKSVNGGLTFSATTLTNCLVVEIIQDPLNASVFVAATNKGIYKSTNSGATWTAQTATNIEFCDMVQKASATTRTLYAATRENASRFFRSNDFGTTWTQITSGITTSVGNIQAGARVAVTPADTNVVYFAAIGGLGIIHRSADGGSTFVVKKPENVQNLTGYDNSIASGGGQGNYNNCITVDRTNASKLWYQSHNTWRSSDDGATWVFLHHWPNMIHTDAHDIKQNPHNPTQLYAMNDGGVWISTDDGDTWTPRSDGLYAYEIGTNASASSHTNRDYIVLGTQDNGKLYRDGTNFVTIGGGDDYTRKEYDYLPNGGFFYNLDGVTRTAAPGGGSSVTYGLPSTIGSLDAVAFTRVNAELGFVGRYNVYRTTNLSSSSPTWVQISTFSTPIMAMHSCVADANKLYVITNDQKMYVSTNALSSSPVFSAVNLPSSTSSVASVVAIANNANTVYISINASVYVSYNSGATWTNITYNLPAVNHRKILAEEYGGTQELVFVATNNAVYYKKAGQTTWTNYSTNLPSRKSPTGFHIFDNGTNQALIRFATYGRGIWESTFDNLRAYKAEIVMVGDSTITCAQPAVQFADGSVGTTNTPIAYSWSFPGGTPSSSTSSSQSVVYTASGNYSITLTITDALNNVSSKTITKYIQVVSCDTDTIPGRALQVQGTTNYAKGTVVPLGTTNTITLSAWIRISSTQVANAGIVFSGSGGATGLNFKSGNQLGYHYNNSSSTYGYSGGPVVPMNQWVHVALVTTPINATIYMNGVPYVNNFANPVVNFSSPFNFGNDRNNTSRTMSGEIDEICIYNRSLSQAEIRELMHLTRNHTSVDPSLKAYYQCNEVGNTLYDRAGSANATLSGSSTHVVSTAPVGSGNSERQTITTNGLKTFASAGVNLTFGSGTLPNGEICVTRLNLQPDALPVGAASANGAEKYWIINNYGSNSTFTSLVNMTLTGFGNISASEATTPNKFKLYRRGVGAFDYSSWALLDSASAATSGTAGVLTFTGPNNNSFSRQFTVVKTLGTITYTLSASSAAEGTISPSGTTVVLAGSSQTFTISPNACFEVADVLVDGVSVGAITSYTFSNIIANHTISVTYVAGFAISSSTGPNGLISPLGFTSVSCGGSQTYTITPNFCNQVSNVLVDGVSVGAVTTYTFANVSAPHSISATFSPIVPCATDTVPGSALSILGTTNYAAMPPVPLGNTNTVTMSAWIKIESIQPSGAAIVMTSSGGACGLNFWSGNQLGYHFNNSASTYNYVGGPIVPMGQWVHVALVTTATNATLYMNGVPYTNAVSNASVNFNSDFYLGNDRGNTARTMTGLIDEVCLYNRSLSQSEVRELMHLTRNNTSVDASLKAYYQCNETGGNVYDRVGVAHGTLLGSSSHVLSTAPVGKGTSQRQTITTSGLKSFPTVGLNLNFGSGTLPDGEICVTRLQLQPDSVPTSNQYASAAGSYWIINNYGNNTSFTALNGIVATGFGSITAPEAAVPGRYRLFARTTGAFLNSSWGNGIQNASSVTAGTNGVISFSGALLTNFNTQLTIVKNVAYAIAGTSTAICTGSSAALGGTNDPQLTYTWSPTTGLSSSTVSNPVASPLTSTTYTLTTTNTVSGSTAQANVNVSVVPSNLSATAISSAPTNGVFCGGGSVSMTASGGNLPSFVELGTGTLVTAGSVTNSTLGPNPLQNFYGGSRQMMLFTAAELNSLGLTTGAAISGISFNMPSSSTTYALQNLVVKMQSTNLTALSTFVTSGWTTVRSAASYSLVGVGWNSIPFTSNFTWDGVSNILVDISFSNNNAGSSGNTARYGTTSFVSTLFYRVDNQTATAVENFAGSPTYTYSARNNVRFALSPAATSYTWSPVDGLNQSTGSTVLASPTSTTTYTVSAVVAGACGSTASKLVTLPTYTIVSTSGANGSIAPLGSSTISCGSNATYTMTANAGYSILDVLVDGIPQGAIASYSFSSVQAPHTIEVTFAIDNTTTWYQDADGDGFGNASVTATGATAPLGYVADNTDCNDGNEMIYPGADAYCNLYDADCDGSVDNDGLPVLTLYQDADGDGFGNPAVSLLTCNVTFGYVNVAGDCNDVVGLGASIYPGAAEMQDGIDNNCNGLVDEGFGPTNDQRTTPRMAIFSTYGGACSFINGTLLGATPSAEATATCLTGEDVWYAFTAGAVGISIEVVSSANNVVLELQTESGISLNAENAVGNVGNEVLNYSGLVIGQSYVLCVRNYNSNVGSGGSVGGPFQVCMKPLSHGQCLSYPNPLSLCDVIHARFVRANAYIFNFTNTNTNITYTKTVSNGGTLLPLNTVQGLLPGQSYALNISAVYNLVSGSGSQEVLTIGPISGQSACIITMAPHPNIALRAVDQCPYARKLTYQVANEPWVCSAEYFEYKFTQVLPSPGLPIYKMSTQLYSRFLTLSTVAGLTLGSTYAVEIRPIYAGGHAGAWSASPSCLKIIGATPFAELEEEEEEVMVNVADGETPSAEVEALLYPNPTRGMEVNLRMSGYGGRIDVKVIDLAGKLWYARSYELGENEVVTMNLEGLSNGLYNVMITTESEVLQRKLVVAR